MVPLRVTKQGTSASTDGKQVRSNFYKVCRIVSEMYERMLGPKGSAKLLVDEIENTYYALDAASTFNAIRNNLNHPLLRFLAEGVNALERDVGDNVKTMLILLGELVKRAEELTSDGVKLTNIISGYSKALDTAVTFLNELKTTLSLDHEIMMRIALNGLYRLNLPLDASTKLAELIIDCVATARETIDSTVKVDLRNIRIRNKLGGDVSDSFVVRGVIIDKFWPGHVNMPKRIKDARVAVLTAPLEFKRSSLKYDFEVVTNDIVRMRHFIKGVEDYYQEIAETVRKVGANVVISKKEVHDLALESFAKRGIMVMYRFDDEDLEFIVRATGAKAVHSVKDLSPSDLGEAEVVEQRIVGSERWIVIDGCRNAKASTLVIKASSYKALKAAEATVRKVMKVLKCMYEKPHVVPGGGATEVYLASRIRKWALKLVGQEQLVALKVAECFEKIPALLAYNAGRDPLEVLTHLRSEHAKGEIYSCIGPDGEVTDARLHYLFEPLYAKEVMMKVLKELLIAILRIDNVVIARQIKGNVKLRS